jgi:hypothetical protein
MILTKAIIDIQKVTPIYLGLMSENNKDELFKAIIKKDGINFRGVSINDLIDTVIAKEGNNFENRNGTLPNYKYFVELGEMEELILVYTYNEEDKSIYNLEVRLKTYPKYYWKEAGNTDIRDFYEKTKTNSLGQYLEHFVSCKNKIIKHFEEQLGPPEIEFKDYVYKLPHQNYSKHTWISNGFRLVLINYLNDLNEPRGGTTMELVLILSAI